MPAAAMNTAASIQSPNVMVDDAPVQLHYRALSSAQSLLRR